MTRYLVLPICGVLASSVIFCKFIFWERHGLRSKIRYEEVFVKIIYSEMWHYLTYFFYLNSDFRSSAQRKMLHWNIMLRTRSTRRTLSCIQFCNIVDKLSRPGVEPMQLWDTFFTSNGAYQCTIHNYKLYDIQMKKVNKYKQDSICYTKHVYYVIMIYHICF